MFVVTESIGAVVARIAAEAGIRPQELTVTEDRLVVVFGSAKPVAAEERRPGTSGPSLPAGPWVPTEPSKHGRPSKWTCEGVTVTISDLSKAYGVSTGCMRQRLMKGNGMAVTTKNRSKFERKNGRARMALEQQGAK